MVDPVGIAVDPTVGDVFVCDSYNNRVHKFTATGTYLKTVGGRIPNGPSTGGSYPGTANGEFCQPQGIAVDKRNGNVYVTDWGNNRVQKFDKNLNFLLAWGSSGAGDQHFNRPLGIVVDSLGDVYVSDTGNFRITKFDASGRYLRQWKIPTISGPALTSVAAALAIGPHDEIYAYGTHTEEVLQYNTSGTLVRRWKVRAPVGGVESLAVGSFGEIYVGHTSYGRIDVFEPDGTYITTINHLSFPGRNALDVTSLAFNPRTGFLYLLEKALPRVDIAKPF
jgi:DNA-binding beta-propeller fold protein YncE